MCNNNISEQLYDTSRFKALYKSELISMDINMPAFFVD